MTSSFASLLEQKNVIALCLLRYGMPAFVINEVVRLSFTDDEIVMRTKHIKWHWVEQTMDMHKSENMLVLSEDNTVTMDFVERHLDKPWDYRALSRNTSCTMDFVEHHLDKP